MKVINLLVFQICFLTSVCCSQDTFWVHKNGPFGGMTHSIVFNSAGDVFIATGDRGSGLGKHGVFRSSNRGAKWVHVDINQMYGNSINCMEVCSNDVIYAGSYFGGVYKSEDNGIYWEIANGELMGGKVIDAITSVGDSIVIAGTRKSKIFRSADRGATWTEILDQQATMRTLDVGPDDKVYSGSLSFAFCSSDSGQTWQKMDTFDHIGVDAYAFFGSDTIFAATRYSTGVYISINNGKTWSQCNNGLASSARVTSITSYDKNHLFLGTRRHGIYYSEDFGKNWVSVNAGLTRSDILSVNSGKDGRVYAATDGGIFVSDNLGIKWSESNSGLYNIILRTMTLDQDQKILYTGTSGGVQKSTDSGDTWKRINTGLVNYDGVMSLAINNKGVIFAGTNESGIYRSLDSETWSEINNELLKNTRINSILFDSTGNIFISAVKHINNDTYGMFRSNDNGDNWQQINKGLPELDITETAVNADGMIFVGSYSSGIFYSDNAGDQWHKVGSESIGNSRIYALKIDERDRIYTGLWDGTSTKLYQSADNGISWDIIEDCI